MITILHALSEEIPDPPDWMQEIVEKLTRSRERIEADFGA